jgi:hypothetical protein
MQRRSFLWGLLVAPATTLAGLSTLLQACAGGSETPATAPCDGAMPSSMTGAHTHALCVSAALLASPMDSTLTTGETLGHTHTVFLTAAQISNIQSGNPVPDMTEPDTTGHSHTVNFN